MNPMSSFSGCLRSIRMSIGVLLFLSIAGCAAISRTEYRRPEVALPDQWRNQPDTGEQVLAVENWWRVFEDKTLNELIERVLKRNNDLTAATLKVRRVRVQAGLQTLKLGPDFSISADTGIQKNLDTGIQRESSTATASLSWELDLWGKLAASRDAAEWEARATEEDRASTALSLVGTTADLYWRIAYLNQAIATSRAGIAYTQKTLELVRVRYLAGAASNLEQLQAEQQIESQKADLSDLEQQMSETRNALAVLFDQAPENSTADPKRLSEMALPALSAGIPAAVLGNRPDLRAAELRLRVALADMDTTRYGYYPDLNLTAALGTSSAQLIELLSNPIATLGAGLTLPFVQWRQTRLDTRISELTYRQAVVEFRQTLYEALKDVENALSARKNYLIQEAALSRSAELAQKAEQVAEIRYRQGKTGVQEWLDQQERRRTADLALAGNRYNQLKNMMTLYQAIGGNTKMPDNNRP